MAAQHLASGSDSLGLTRQEQRSLAGSMLNRQDLSTHPMQCRNAYMPGILHTVLLSLGVSTIFETYSEGSPLGMGEDP